MFTQEKLREMIKGNVIVEGECITWIGSKIGKGGRSGTACHDTYGTVSIRGKNYRIHRLVYQVFVEYVPNHLDVLHTCNNKSCINTDHLYVGTARENLYVAYRDGCFTDGRRSFTKDELELVRSLKDSCSLREIGRRLNCDHHKVSRAIDRLTNLRGLAQPG